MAITPSELGPPACARVERQDGTAARLRTHRRTALRASQNYGLPPLGSVALRMARGRRSLYRRWPRYGGRLSRGITPRILIAHRREAFAVKRKYLSFLWRATLRVRFSENQLQKFKRRHRIIHHSTHSLAKKPVLQRRCDESSLVGLRAFDPITATRKTGLPMKGTLYD